MGIRIRRPARTTLGVVAAGVIAAGALAVVQPAAAYAAGAGTSAYRAIGCNVKRR